MSNTNTVTDLTLHIMYHDLHTMDRNEAEDRICCDILGGYLPPLTQEDVDFAFSLVKDIESGQC
jgi:hypothetical protein